MEDDCDRVGGDQRDRVRYGRWHGSTVGDHDHMREGDDVNLDMLVIPRQ